MSWATQFCKSHQSHCEVRISTCQFFNSEQTHFCRHSTNSLLSRRSALWYLNVIYALSEDFNGTYLVYDLGLALAQELFSPEMNY